MGLAYVCAGVLGIFAIRGDMGRVGIPLVLTISIILLASGAFQLVSAGVVCKPIRFVIYYMSCLAAISLGVVWVAVLTGGLF